MRESPSSSSMAVRGLPTLRPAAVFSSTLSGARRLVGKAGGSLRSVTLMVTAMLSEVVDGSVAVTVRE